VAGTTVTVSPVSTLKEGAKLQHRQGAQVQEFSLDYDAFKSVDGFIGQHHVSI
jgi:hypothetical protein